MPAKTSLDRVFGGLPLAQLFVVDTSDPAYPWLPTPVDGTKIANISVHRGRDSALSQPTASTLSLTVAGDLATSAGDPLDLMTAVQLRLNAAAIAAARPGLSITPERFTGRVTDLGDVAIDPRSRGQVTPLIAASLIGKLSQTTYNLGVIANNTSDVTILDNVFTALWLADAGVRFGAWAADPSIWTAPLDANGPLPSTHRFGQIDASSGDLAGLLSAVVTSSLGVVYELKDGTIGYVRPDSRQPATAFVEIPTSAVIAPAQASKRIADVINYQEASYVNTDGTSGGVVRSPALTDLGFAPADASIDVFGYYPGGALSTLLNHQADAQAVADFITARYGLPSWRLSTVTVDVLKLFTDDLVDDVVVEDFLNLELEDLVKFSGSWPAHSPVEGGRLYWVIAIDEAITSTSWRVTLTVVDWQLLAPDQTWADLPATLTWADIPATLDWRRMAAYQP